MEIKDSLKILRVIIDSILSSEEHLKTQLNQAYAKTKALRRIRCFITMQEMIQLYKAFILPHLEYCAPLLIGITKSLSDKLEDANNYILWTLLGLPKSISMIVVLD